MRDKDWLLSSVRSIHEDIRAAVTSVCEASTPTSVARVLSDVDGEGDTIYFVDRVSESMLVELFSDRIASRVPIVLIAEGLSGGKVSLPQDVPESEAVWRIIADPIDGTRPLMYQKRSAWILTGIAPNRGDSTTLADIELAVQTELPLIKQHLCDSLWAIRGEGVRGERFNRITSERQPLSPRPSTAKDLTHGFSSITRFFSGGRDILASIDDEISIAAVGANKEGKAYSFEDQYLSTGGQLYELIMGHDRFQADLRPLLFDILRARGLQQGLCCHPYDLCTELIARESGLFISDETGLPLDAPLDLTTDVTWVGYANAYIRSQISPLLHEALKARGLSATRGNKKDIGEHKPVSDKQSSF